jgi:hypothetical protein
MPFYDWMCECGKKEGTYVHKPSPVAPKCECGEVMSRDWHSEALPGNAGSQWPMVTKNLTGKEEVITSEAHLQQRCREEGVTHRPDNAWVSKRQVGTNWQTGEPIYHEGSGAGEPGSWV